MKMDLNKYYLNYFYPWDNYKLFFIKTHLTKIDRKGIILATKSRLEGGTVQKRQIWKGARRVSLKSIN